MNGPSGQAYVGCALHASQDSYYDVATPISQNASSQGSDTFEGFEDGLVPTGKTRDGKRGVWLHANVSDVHTNTTQIFVSEGGAMQTVQFAGTMDVSISGGHASSVIRKRSDVVDALSQVQSSPNASPDTIDPSLDTRNYHVSVALTNGLEEDDVALVDPMQHLNLLINVGVLTASATVAETHGGTGSESLSELLRTGTALIPIKYGRWPSMRRAVSLRDVHLRTHYEAGKGDVVHWKQAPINGILPTLDQALVKSLYNNQASVHLKSFIDMVKETVTLRRTTLVYPPLPGLSKIFTAHPTLGFTSVEALLHSPTGLHADQLEALLQAMVHIALQHDTDAAERMLEQGKSPPTAGTASKWRVPAARAIHLAIRMATEYRTDGVVDVDAQNNLVFRDLESWLPHASRNFFLEANDCDGSALTAMRLGRQIGLSPFGDERYRSDGLFISYDPNYDEDRHVWTRAVRNSLVFTDTMVFTIVGASNGQGTNVVDQHQRQGGRSQRRVSGDARRQPGRVAGHAVAMWLPTASVLEAMNKWNQRDHSEMQYADSVLIERARARVLFPEGKLRAQNMVAEQGMHNLIGVRETLLHQLKELKLAPIAIDGTVTSELDLAASGKKAAQRASIAKENMATFQRMGPTVADRVVDLTVVGPNMSHAFYLDFVEALVSGRMGDDPELVELGAAAFNFAFVPPSRSNADAREVTQVGSTPDSIHHDEYMLAPLATVDKERLHALDLLRALTRFHAMPPRSSIANRASVSQIQNAQRAVDRLHALTQDEKFAAPDGEETLEVAEMYVTPRAMWGNPFAIDHLIERLEAVAKRIEIEMVDLTGVQDNAIAVVINVAT
jgi:hypothetical protein